MISANQTPTILTITTPGPQGPQGPPGDATTGSNTFVGNQTITGSIFISGSIIPAVGAGELTSSFNLGSENAAWKEIFVSEGSIRFIKSGSSPVVLSAKDGGIQINSGSVISADGVSGQFSTSKSLSDNVTVKDSNNSLLMGPIEVETNKEISVEDGSDLTIFGDIDTTTPDNLSISTLTATNNISTSGKVNSSFFTNNKTINSNITVNSNEDALIIGETNIEEDKEISIEDDSELTIFGDIETPTTVDSASFATTASYALDSNPTFPYSGSAIITGSLLVNDGTYDIINTSNLQLNDSTGGASINWNSRFLQNGNGTPLDWDARLLQSSNADEFSIDWENRILYANDGTTAHLDWSNPSYMSLPSITENPIVSVLGIDGGGRIYSTASSAIGGGGASFPYTGSAVITGSLVVTGSTTSTLGFTGSLFGTASWAQSALQALTSSLLIGTASSVNIETITNSPTITGNNYLYGTGVNSTLSIPSTSTGSLQLGRNIFLATPTNGNITLYGGVSVTITSSQVSMVGNNFNLGTNTDGFTNRSQILQTGTTSTIHISSSQILLDGTHPSGSVLFVTGSVVPTGVPANLNDGPGGNSLNRAAVQFAKSGSGDNYLLYVYIGGRWRSASLF